ncbi:hypothetical protein BDV93DRAFT_548795 [Ceratobasidium sp. AG-I]|nr:hypothetical protein BDV93DRAFT_548795 [Ceratobasidium sp. AG-I]
MPTSSLIRNIPSHVLYTLELKLVGQNTEPNIRPRVILKATLTEMANKLGVRFDESEENNLFDLSNKLGNINGQYSWGGINFQKTAKNLDIVPLPCGARLLQADLQSMGGQSNNKMPFNLDEYIGLVGYSHPLMNETYYKLGLKLPAIKEASVMRTLVLCFDGTSNHFSNRNTNVVKLVELLKNDDPERQMVYYQTGVGTYVSPGWMTSGGEKIAKKADEAVAWYLYQHVIDGYKYLMETYRAGDRICIFGFSRGAYIARAVAGMVHAVGLLPRHNVEHIPYAYRLYEQGTQDKCPNNYGALSTSRDDEGLKITPENYKATFCIPVKIDFVGVWDTVASMGSIVPKVLPWIDFNPSIRVFRHALSLDERRGNFVPSLWNHELTNHELKKPEPENPELKKLKLQKPKLKGPEPAYDHQDVREVWFKGQHTDVGGGAPQKTPKNTAHSNLQGGSNGETPPPFTMLSNISLRWMIRQCLETDASVVFNHTAIAKYRDQECQVLENNEAIVQKVRGEALQVREEGRLKQAPGGNESEESQEVIVSGIAPNYAEEKSKAHQYLQELRAGSLAASAELDKHDIKHEPYDAMKSARGFGFLGWHFLEFWPSVQPVLFKQKLVNRKMPNFFYPRVVNYQDRRDITQSADSPREEGLSDEAREVRANSTKYPIRVHASLVDFLNSDKSSTYRPRALWRGVREGEFPKIEDSRNGAVQWLDNGRLAMKPGLKPPTGWRVALRTWWSFSSRSKSLIYATGVVAIGASIVYSV